MLLSEYVFQYITRSLRQGLNPQSHNCSEVSALGSVNVRPEDEYLVVRRLPLPVLQGHMGIWPMARNVTTVK